MVTWATTSTSKLNFSFDDSQQIYIDISDLYIYLFMSSDENPIDQDDTIKKHVMTNYCEEIKEIWQQASMGKTKQQTCLFSRLCKKLLVPICF